MQYTDHPASTGYGRNRGVVWKDLNWERQKEEYNLEDLTRNANLEHEDLLIM
jgi:hypothetical protein